MNIPAPFSENQMRFFWGCFDHWFNVAEGGKRGGKNVLITMAYCTILEKHPSRIHLIAGVSTATARLNILDCDGFGLKNYFEGRCREGTYQNRDCLYIQTATGEKVVLVSGGGKAGDEKLIKGNTYGTAYITEVNECSEAFIQEVFDRTLSSPDRKVFHDLNPKAEGHWYYKTILDFHEAKQRENPDYGLNYGHFTIADNMVDPSAASFITALRQRGVYVMEANNDVLNGIRRCSTLISKRRLLVSKACIGLLDEFGLYRWDDKAALLGVEKPVKENDHAMDALRYFVNSLPDWRFEHVQA